MSSRKLAFGSLCVLIVGGLVVPQGVFAADPTGFDHSQTTDQEVWQFLVDERNPFEDPWGVEVEPLAWPDTQIAATADESQWVAQAAEQEKVREVSGDGKSLAEKATDPTSILKQFQIQNTFIPDSYGASGSSNQFILQPVLPIPKSSGFPLTQIIRPTLPYVSTANPDGPLGRDNGWGDLALMDLFIKKCDWGTVGVGPYFIFPTATSDFTGQGKYQAGPAFVAIYNKVPKWTLGVLAYNPISFAGDDDRDAVSTFTVQPVAIRHFDKGLYAGLGDLPLTYEWHSNNYAIPLSLKIGKVTKICEQNVNLFVQPSYTPWHDGPTSEWSVKVGCTFLFP